MEQLSKILLQSSTIELKTDSFLALTKRLDSFKSSSQITKSIENLFQASLNLAPTEFDLQYRKDQLQGAVDGLRRRVTRLNGQVGEWARKEVREAIFEKAIKTV